MNEKLKFENIMVNVELTQYKLANAEVSPSSSSEYLPKFNEDFEKLKYDLDELRIEKAKVEKELELRKERSISQFGIPKWIENAQTKRTEGLGFISSKHKGKKKYVDLPSYKVCTFCGKTGHLVATCNKKEQSVSKNVRQVWVLVRGNNTWYLDSGCSKHMTGDKSKFLSLEAYPGGSVTFRDNKKGEVIAKGKVGRSSSHSIENVPLVEGLMHNLLSISQFCDKGNSVSFTSDSCNIINDKTGRVVLEGTRKGNTYIVDLNSVPRNNLTCLSAINDDPLLWHKRFGHASFSLMDKLRARNLVIGLPSVKFLIQHICDACVRGKQNSSGNQIIHIRSDHGTEFENSRFDDFCKENGMDHNFPAPRTPQQNGVVERNNRTLEDMARTILIASGLPRNFWAEAINTACYTINRVMMRPIINKTPYELFKGRKPNISHFQAFGCRCFVHNNWKRNIGKFDERSDEAVFLGYASNSKAYRVYNKNTLCVEESIQVIFDESNMFMNVQEQDNNDYEIGMIRDREEDEETSKQTKEVREEPEQEHKENAEVPNQENPEERDHGEPGNKENGEEIEEEVPQIGVPAREFQPKPFRYRGSHPTYLIISDIGRGTQTRSQLRNFCPRHFNVQRESHPRQ
ncbi:uncharacterized protein LOC110686665 [Chenopodium quinoa]|uniref:uncharacterized protein LOC110686665 n=1 Tax=Chenopodium quinoa TaxID=63459 RepID=UPI000B78E729|nr:uncharacterized protein LOC110686665 [Chenopodium quinoa]